ncbi:hypothetical protein BKA93DRAFT_830876 [Sparassis latifolia]
MPAAYSKLLTPARAHPYQRCISSSDTSECTFKNTLKHATQLYTFEEFPIPSLLPVAYPCDLDRTPIPLQHLKTYAKEHDWLSNIICFCTLRGGDSAPVKIFVPFTGEHMEDPCLGCASWKPGRSGGCSFFVNVRRLVDNAKSCNAPFNLTAFPKKQLQLTRTPRAKKDVHKLELPDSDSPPIKCESPELSLQFPESPNIYSSPSRPSTSPRSIYEDSGYGSSLDSHRAVERLLIDHSASRFAEGTGTALENATESPNIYSSPSRLSTSPRSIYEQGGYGLSLDSHRAVEQLLIDHSASRFAEGAGTALENATPGYVHDADRIWSPPPRRFAYRRLHDLPLPLEDDIVATILKLIDHDSPSVTYTDLMCVLGACRVCGLCMGLTRILTHPCSGDADSASSPAVALHPFDTSSAFSSSIPSLEDVEDKKSQPIAQPFLPRNSSTMGSTSSFAMSAAGTHFADISTDVFGPISQHTLVASGSGTHVAGSSSAVAVDVCMPSEIVKRGSTMRDVKGKGKMVVIDLTDDGY